MKVRKLYKDVDHYNIVWFGVEKVDKEYYAVLDADLYNPDTHEIKHYNYGLRKPTNEDFELYCSWLKQGSSIVPYIRNDYSYYYINKNEKIFLKISLPSDGDREAALLKINEDENNQFYLSVLGVGGITGIDNANKKIKLEGGSTKIYDKINDEDLDSILERNDDHIYKCKKLVDSYSSDIESIKNNLIQRLSIIQGELWFRIYYGIPLTSKVRNKGILDSIVVNIITDCPGVKGISEFKSTVDSKNGYVFNFTATTFDDKDIDISLTSN